MINFTGSAKFKSEVVDFTTIVGGELEGVSAWLGMTERGEVGVPKLVGSWNEYQAEFGGIITENNFPLYCRLALDLGAKLLITRIAHYTDITDATTLVGIKATNTLTVGLNSTVFTAKNIGAWGNEATVTVVAAANGIPNTVDITESLAGFPQLSNTIYNAATAPTSLQKLDYNSRLRLVSIGTITGLIPVGAVTLASGTPTLANMASSLVEADYIGDAGSVTGIRALDEYSEFKYTCIPTLASGTIDDALSAYAILRFDHFAIHRTPIGLAGTNTVAYRMKTGAYSGLGSMIDSWQDWLFTGGWKVSHPSVQAVRPNQNGVTIEVPEVVALAAILTNKDIKNPDWFSFSGDKRGKVKNSIGVVYNFGVPARGTEFDNIVNYGVNALINTKAGGVQFWGNKTLYRTPSLLQKTEVAEVVMFFLRSVPPVIRPEFFDPNDIDTWKNVYRAVKKLGDYAKANRGVWDYLYEGDQDITKVEEAVVNAGSIDTGAYYFNLWLKPKVSMIWVGMKIGVTNSNVSFALLDGQPE
jgi:hypothetical protein